MGCDVNFGEVVTKIGITFSILERIEWAATGGDKAAGSGGSVFQYPRTDRMGCDPQIEFYSTLNTLLSVSSNGSNGLRR